MSGRVYPKSLFEDYIFKLESAWSDPGYFTIYSVNYRYYYYREMEFQKD